MSTIEEIKAEVDKLSREERIQLFMHLCEEFEPWTKQSLRQTIEAGIDDIEQGRFKEYDETALAHCFDEVKQRGGQRLAAAKSATA